MDKLRETRAFTGFNRVFPENGFSLETVKACSARQTQRERWLPAYWSTGKASSSSFAKTCLQEWESEPRVQERAEQLPSVRTGQGERRHLRAR